MKFMHSYMLYDVIAKLTDYRVDKPYKLSQDLKYQDQDQDKG